MKKLAFLAALAGLVWAAVFTFPDPKLHLVFCDVGQGDAILIQRGSNQVLIDGGPDERVIECLSDHLPFWDRTIELVVLTHPQADHLTGLIEVLARYQVESFIANNIASDTERFWRFREVLLAEKAKIYSLDAGAKLEASGLSLTALWPEEQLGDALVWRGVKKERILGLASDAANLNETSVVLRLEFGDFCALLTGDISQATESRLTISKHCQVLKVAHHGSKYSTSEAFVQEIQPELAVISVGKNSFGHPSREVLEGLQAAGVRTLRTDQNGEIEIVSDGQKWGFLSESQ